MSLVAKQIYQLLYEQGPIQRFTQDSPILPDVWLAFAEDPDGQQDLLLTPYRRRGGPHTTPGHLSLVIQEGLRRNRARMRGFKRRQPPEPHNISYSQTAVAVKVYLDEMIRVILPLSGWWYKRIRCAELSQQMADLNHPKIKRDLALLLSGAKMTKKLPLGPDVLWIIRVLGVILKIKEVREKFKVDENADDETQEKQQRALDRAIKAVWPPPKSSDVNRPSQERIQYFEELIDRVDGMLENIPDAETPLVHTTNLNRKATCTVWQSTKAIKADAARGLFDVRCNNITWAVIDSGIDATHPAFRILDERGNPLKLNKKDFARQTRIVKTFDFTIIRDLLSSDVRADLHPSALAYLKQNRGMRTQLRRSLQSGREIDWAFLLPLLEITHDQHYMVPKNDHGTHVAGILGADWRTSAPGADEVLDGPVEGVCPEIRIYDLRVLDANGTGDEFNVMAAMQFIRYLNSRSDSQVIHGANLSLSIRHEVANYACGRTPVCEECDRLTASGVIVVAAAGNRGYIRRQGDEEMEGYRTVSLTDPGNAATVITVGATHRNSPHTYGVSYFSSRGPTGDGRLKPDLVAPGEKIESCVPDNQLRRLDGTSMAAPHVSGAAAMLISRHRELIGQPERVKQILCKTATDLGRERYFQGAGMLDILRALQAV
jgi:serine protease AprX